MNQQEDIKRLKELREHKKLKRELEPTFFQKVDKFIKWFKK